MKKKYLSIYGLRRSGNHAVIAWLINNMSEGSAMFRVKHPLILAKDTCFINDITACYSDNINLLRIDHLFARSNFKNLIISHEDESTSFTSEFTLGMRKVVVVRDIKNLLASRLRKLRSNPDCELTKKLMRVNEDIINLWIEHTQSILEKKIFGIKFEEWANNKTYRDNIALSLGIKNIDIIDTVLPYGSGSSFMPNNQVPPSKQELNNRYLEEPLGDAIEKRLNSSKIIELRRKLGYCTQDSQ